MEKLGKFGHHPDDLIDAQVEVDRLTGLLAEAMAALGRASEYRAVTPNGISIRHTVLYTLSNLAKSCPTESRRFQPHGGE
jgi:hypothetical protein